MVDYAEILCQSVDTIISKKLEGINFDTTLTCTITNIDNAELGQYTVTNGSATFTAYSTNTDYKVDDTVYVTVPNGDFNLQKIIIGKQVTESSEPFVFTNPFKTILDVSNNLIIGNIGEKGLVANGSIEEVLVWEDTFYNKELKDYTRLGLSADFKTWLSNTVTGTYGLKLVVFSEEELTTSLNAAYAGIYDILENNDDLTDQYEKMEKFYDIGWGTNDVITFEEFKEKSLEDKKSYIQELMASGITKYEMYLSTEDMYGNPYNFETYFNQEKVFDISSFGRILKMELYFYLTAGTFFDNNGELIEHQDFLGNDLTPNIFVREPYLCIGYDLNSFLSEEAILYTLDSSTYIASTAVSDVDNLKNIQLRWLHQFSDNTIAQVDVNTELDYDVRWYRYNLGAPSADEYSGVYWERTNLEKVETNTEELEVLDKIKNYQLLFHYENNNINNSVTNEYTYYKNFKPGYDDGNGGEIIPTNSLSVINTYSYLNYWSSQCLDYYGFSSDFALHAFVGWTTDSILVTEDQGWEDLFERGFVYHNKSWSLQDYYTKKTFSQSGCLHRVGFWELFTVAYRFYWLYPDKFERLGVSNIWKTGGLANPSVWEKYAGKNLYEDLSYSGNNLLDNNSGTLFTLSTMNTPLRNLFTYFTLSFGEWDYVQDDYGLRDFRPKDDELYEQLYNEVLNLYSKIDNPTYTVIIKPDIFSYQLQPDLTLSEEKIKVIILYENTPIRSNVLTFTNEREVVNQVTVDVTSAVQIVCNDGTYGNYRIYNEGNELLDSSQSKYCRELLCCFDSSNYPDEASALTEATSITWIFPATNTMLRAADDTGTVLDYTSLAKAASSSSNGIVEITSESAHIIYNSILNLISITRYAGADGVSIDPKLYYYIYSYFSTAYSNNTIQCEVVKDSVTYYGVKECTFGIAGTSGTDCTLIIDFDNNETAVTIGGQYLDSFSNKISSFKTPTLTARLYDSENNPIDLNDRTSGKDYTFEWSWFCAQLNIEAVDESSLPKTTEYKVISLTEKSFNDSTTTYYTKNSDSEDYVEAGTYKSTETYYFKQDSVVYDAVDPDDLNYYIKIVGGTTELVELQLKNEADLITYTYTDESDNIILDETKNTSLQDRMNSLWILQVKLTGWGDYDLIAYKPIPLRRYYPDKLYLCITGPTSVIYASTGEPNYYKDPYKIWLAPREDNITEDGDWRIFLPSYTLTKDGSNSSEKDSKYVGSLSSNNVLQPLNCYVTDAPLYGVQYTDLVYGLITWTLPIITILNNYPSAMLNQWNGSDIVMDDETGTIISSAIAAGRKESDNTFSGVMLGDWSRSSVESAISSLTGLYGFHHGGMSYAFKDDGTGFIGKANKGRIYFDGEGSLIYSEEWLTSNGKIGMLLDLDDGYIYMNQGGGYDAKYPTQEEFSEDTYYEFISYQRVANHSSIDKTKTYYLPYTFLAVELTTSSYVLNKYFTYTKTTKSETLALSEIEDDLDDTKHIVNTSRVSDSNEYVITTKDYTENELSSDTTESESTAKKWKRETTVETYKLATSETFNSSATYYKVNKYSKATDEELDYFKATDYFYIYVNDYVIANVFDIDTQYYLKTTDESPHYITLSSQKSETYPLAIGTSQSTSDRTFRVAWDGTTHINNGYFTGEINAKSGTLGNLTVTGTLYGGTISGSSIYSYYLQCTNGDIGGWKVSSTSLTGGTVALDSTHGILLKDAYLYIAPENGSFTNYYGKVGFLEAETLNAEDNKQSEGVGCLYESSKIKSLIKCTSINSGLSFYDSNSGEKIGGWLSISSKAISLGTTTNMTIYLGSANTALLKCQVPAEQQEGIYARFG